MSVAGRLTVLESDDARFEVGSEHDVRLYPDGHFDAANEQAVPNPDPSVESPASDGAAGDTDAEGAQDGPETGQGAGSDSGASEGATGDPGVSEGALEGGST